MMTDLEPKQHSVFYRCTFGEPIVLFVIALNAFAVYLGAFPSLSDSSRLILDWVDYLCLIYFVVELFVKLASFSIRGYWENPWNRLDFFIVLASLPLLLEPPWSEGSALGVLAITPLLRLGRFLRFARVMRVIPNANHIWKGSARALRASVGVFLVLLTLNLVLALGANLLFGEILPEHFGNPLISSYTLFKVFTIEGWYEIPDSLALSGGDKSDVLFLRLYMIVSVLVGGILGLSLANAVFVDEMVNDNNEELERRVSELAREIRLLRDELKAVPPQEALVADSDGPAD